MTSRHLVRRGAEAAFSVPGAWRDASKGFRRWSVVDEDVPGAVHTGFGVCELDAGGAVAAHVHSYEESVYVLAGELVCDTAEGSWLLRQGDYGLLPVGVAHAWRNPGTTAARWAELCAPQPRRRFDDDTELVPPLREGPALPIDVRDPRTRAFGHIAPEHTDPAKQSQDLLAVSASMRTALLVYGGINVKMMIDADLGAQLSTMFMVHYDPDGATGGHDHPLEETYLILDGVVDATFDGQPYRLEAGDVAWAGVGCVHSFANAGAGTLRWLETQAPAPPSRHSYRFRRDWDHLRDVLSREERT